MNPSLSLLIDNTEQSKKYPVLQIPSENVQLIPDLFDGRDHWNLYIQPPSKTPHIASWSIVAKDVINDRFTLLSGGQISFNFDHFNLLSCIDKKPSLESYKNQAVSNASLGYNIFDAWEIIYSRGLSQVNCFSYQKLKDLNYETPDNLSYEQKVKAYGFECETISGKNQVACLTKINNLPVARRTFLSDCIYNITSPDMKMDDKIKAIKYDLTKWGPVAAGFVVYENFITSYTGKTVYNKVEGNILGGHYVSIIGWGDDYWICRNSWGSDWGLMGYFKIKMGLKETKLEDNATGSIPFIHHFDKGQSLDEVMMKWNGKEVSMTDMKQFNPPLYEKRESLKINERLFYTEETIKLIREGKLYGILEPLIENPSALPNPKKFWVMDIQNYTFKTIEEETTESGELKKLKTIDTPVLNYIFLFTFFTIALIIYQYYKKRVIN